MYLKKLQESIGTWSEENFGASGGTLNHETYVFARTLLTMVSEVAHHILKSEQGIRGEPSYHKLRAMRNLWSLDRLLESIGASLVDGNYAADNKTEKSTRKVLGAYEELGELLVAIQNRNEAEQRDALADTIIYLLDCGEVLDICVEDALRETAKDVLGRDWQKHREEDYSDAPIYGGSE